MERIRAETYWRIFDARSVALEGRIGWQKKKGVGPGRGRKRMKGSAGDEVSGGGAGDEESASRL
eukprot:8137779-Ditylum_brightwellii.AAC.1